MRIVCDGCGAKYQVDDSKVENRSFKFPCKKCGEKIVVRQNGVQAESATPEAPPAADEAFEPTTQLAYDDHLARQAEEEGAVWYVAVGKERVGPISASDVEAYIAQGEVTGTSFVWCDGMDDWTALEAVPALSRLLPQSHDAGLGAPTGENGVPADGGQTGGEDLFVSEQREATFDEPANSPVISTAQLTGQRHENSVLFSLDSLDNDSKPASGMMTPSATGNTEASGLIDLAMLAGDSQNLDNVFNQAGPSGAPMGAPIKPMASLVTQPKKSRIGLIIAAVAILVAGLTGAVVWFLLKPQQTSIKAATTVATTTPKPAAPAPQAKPVEKAAPKAAAADKPTAAAQPKEAAAKAEPAPASATAATVATKKNVKTAVSKTKPKKAKRSARTKVRTTATKRAARNKNIAKPAPKPKPVVKRRRPKASGDAAALLASLDGGGSKTKSRKNRGGGGGLPSLDTPAVDPTLPERLDRGQVLRAIRRHFSKVKDCRRLEPDISGQVTVRFTVNGNGRVSGTKTTGQYANTPIGDCVAQKVRAIRFPRFSGSPFPINFPFSL